jgi:DNA-binding transcriptional regulator LsrR (DeoR family)
MLKKYVRGERHPDARLTDKKVAELRRLYAETNVTQAELAERFEVAQSTVCNVLARRTWKHV